MAAIYLSSTLLWNSSLEEIFHLAYQSGLDGMELWAQHFFSRGYKEEEFQKLSALYPLKSCIHRRRYWWPVRRI